ncbi:MAG: PilZ domain-containing protein [Myxococcota bacterium]
MQRYDRLALVYDTPETALGAAALGLVQQGLDPLYTTDADEACQLARQEQSRIAALVVSGAIEIARLDPMLREIVPRLAGGAAAIVVVAPPRQRSTLAALRDRGIRWAVWEPYDESELRFAVAAALASGDVLETRRGLRAPLRLPVAIRNARLSREGELRNLSVGGAYVALSEPPEPSASLGLEFPIGERMFRTQATVAHRQCGASDRSAERGPGMGVAFTGMTPLEVRLVAGFVRERVESFRI